MPAVAPADTSSQADVSASPAGRAGCSIPNVLMDACGVPVFRKLLKAIGILIVLLAVAAGVMYYLVHSGRVSLIGLSAMLEASGDIAIANLGDVEVSAVLDPADPDSDTAPLAVDVAAFETGGFGSVPSGAYALRFDPGGTCALEMARGHAYTFVIVPEGIAVARAGYRPSGGDDVDMATSPLCR